MQIDAEREESGPVGGPIWVATGQHDSMTSSSDTYWLVTIYKCIQ